ncbi:GGDEF domain-containing response regulator [Methylotenera versatilis]|jgi:two-component system, cell cycle response regulator|uniref:Response regulator receiver modulated diguanylate cyclase n=1 Tax=Methylotenera versatilis (strain 301) TaxID=666681 RepID=D7DM05_METV0|nr:diguanylate cyclase [Methylotenera versatilis]ADI30699.1 response regulator receiver modulated diguanylate cyclase [Methylotenera versatilis 301]
MFKANIDIFNAHILIVDDQRTNVDLLEQMLEAEGYKHVSSTTNPFAVVDLHNTNEYDLILLDLKMPGMDGFQVMEELRKNNSDIYVPILVITAQPSQKLEAFEAGAKDFISKPFDLMEAKVRIYNMLEVRLLYKQLEQYSRSMESWAMHDALTGLPNRRLFVDRLTLAMAHAHRKKCTTTVIYLDLDGFKLINDSFGHDVGDMLLKIVADRLVAAVRKEDTVARFGGDEFVLVLWELDSPDGVSMLVSKVLMTLSEPYFINGRTIRISACAGVSIYPDHSEDMETLIKKADIALYESKRIGKNGFSIAVDSLS